MIEILTVILLALLIVLALAGLFATGIGLVTLVQFAKPQKLPADESNRINHIRLWWFALTRPEIFVETFPWLTQDEYDNFKNK